MANFDINNFIIDHVLRGTMADKKTGEVLWGVNQISNPSLSLTTETSEVVDALGSKIAEFNRAKNGTFSAENSLFDLGLYAAQNGVEKAVATETEKIVSPIFETLVVGSDKTAVLAHKPYDEITGENVIPQRVYALNGDGTLSTPLNYATSAGAGKFTYVEETKTITFPDSVKAGEEYFIQYEYQTERAVSVTGDGVNFPTAGKFIMEVLGADVCDQSKLIHAYVIFPNAKLDGNVDYTFGSDATHPISLALMQDYCDRKKILFKIVIPDEE